MPGSQASMSRHMSFWIVKTRSKNIIWSIFLPSGGTIPKTADLQVLKSFISVPQSLLKS